MKSLNKAVILGHLGNTPELRTTNTGQSVTNFTVATNNNWRDHNGDSQENTDWHRIVVWGSRADACVRHLQKGARVYIEGRLETKAREVDGNKLYTTQIVAQDVIFLSNKGGASEVEELKVRVAELEAELEECEVIE